MEKNIALENWILQAFKNNKITKVEMQHSSEEGVAPSHKNCYYVTFELGENIGKKMIQFVVCDHQECEMKEPDLTYYS